LILFEDLNAPNELKNPPPPPPLATGLELELIALVGIGGGGPVPVPVVVVGRGNELFGEIGECLLDGISSLVDGPPLTGRIEGEGGIDGSTSIPVVVVAVAAAAAVVVGGGDAGSTATAIGITCSDRPVSSARKTSFAGSPFTITGTTE
jgi:hypothetical protein